MLLLDSYFAILLDTQAFSWSNVCWLACSSCFFTYKCVKEGKPSYWNSLRRLTVEKLALARRFGSGEQSLLGSADGLSSSTGLLSSGQPHSLPGYQSTASCNLCCQTAYLSGGGLNLSASNVYDSVVMGKAHPVPKTSTVGLTRPNTVLLCLIVKPN